MSKPTITYEELVRKDAQANIRRLLHELRIEHVRDGCPLERGYAACVVCEVPARLA